MAELNNYALRLDGPLLRKQRMLLLKLLDKASKKVPYLPETTDEPGLLEGIVCLLDALADQAHDRHGIDCLLAEDPAEEVEGGDDVKP